MSDVARSAWPAGAGDRRAAGTRSCSSLAGNALALLGPQLRDRPCEAYGSDVRVRARAKGGYLYPVVAVACGELAFAKDDPTALLNPTLAAELWGPDDTLCDREATKHAYQELPSLRHYLLVHTACVQVELYTRRGGAWLYRSYHLRGAVIRLPAIGCELFVADLYHDCRFAA